MSDVETTEAELLARDEEAAADLVAFFEALGPRDRAALGQLVEADRTFGEDLGRERATTGRPAPGKARG